MKIISNKVRCKHCGDVIESKHRHDFVWCKCGKVAVDGGKSYLKRAFQTNPDDDYEELSEYTPPEDHDPSDDTPNW